MSDHKSGPTDRRIATRFSRRALLGGVALGATGAGALAVGTREASAQADIDGEFSVTGDSATVATEPTALDAAATGDWAADAARPIEQVRLTLQAGTDAAGIADIATESKFDTTSGTYDLSADVFAEHPDLTAAAFTPADGGETKTTTLTVRVVCSVVVDGSIAAEAAIEDTGPVEVSREGVEAAVGGTGTITIRTA